MDIGEFSLPGANGDGLLEIGEEPIEVNPIADEDQESRGMSKFTEGKPTLTEAEQNELNERLLGATANGLSLKEVKRCLKAGANINAADEHGNTALIHAYDKDNEEVAEFLMKNGADVNAAGRDGWTLLMLACDRGDKEMTLALIANGAYVNVVQDSSYTPLLYACAKGYKEITQVLIANGADVDVVTRSGSTALEVATTKTDIVDLLTAHNQRLDEIADFIHNKFIQKDNSKVENLNEYLKDCERFNPQNIKDALIRKLKSNNIDMSPKAIKEQANLAFGEAITWSTRNNPNNEKIVTLFKQSPTANLGKDVASQISSFLTKKEHKNLLTASIIEEEVLKAGEALAASATSSPVAVSGGKVLSQAKIAGEARSTKFDPNDHRKPSGRG